MSRRLPWLLAPLIILSVVLAGCGSSGGSGGGGSSAPANAKPTYGGTVTFATSAEPVCLDPSYQGDDSQDIIARQFLDNLVSVNKNNTYGPWLATSWTISHGGLTYTFHLRHGVKFTDGTPFDAAAVKANVTHWLAPKTEWGQASELAGLKSVTTPGRYTVAFNLKTANSWLLMDLANPETGIQSPASLKRPQSAICQDPIGTGPFIVQKWIHGDEVIFTRNNAYDTPPPQATHKGKAYLAKLIWKFIPNGATRYAAFSTGSAGIINGIPPENFKTASATHTTQVFDAEVPGVPQQLDLNTTKPPFNNVDVRKAFLYSVDVPAALKSAFFGAYHAPTGVLSPTTPFYDAAYAHVYSYDIAKAKQLLDQAGWSKQGSGGYRTKDGKELTVVLPIYATSQTGVGTETESLYEQLQATAKQAGFNLVIQPVDTAVANTDESDYNYNLYVDYWTVNSPVSLTYVYNSSGIKPSAPGAYHTDVSGIDSPEIDKLEQEGLQTTNRARQQQIYSALQKVITAQAVSLQLYIYPLQVAENTGLARGFAYDWSEPVPTLYDTWVPMHQ